MRNTGYILTDWIFFFSKDNQESLTKIFDAARNRDVSDEFVTWKLIIAFLPLIPFLLVLGINISANPIDAHLFYTFVNNGSLPIISFGIISSGMPYLLEQLGQYPEYHSIRRRVMAISLLFLFLSTAIYIMQTLYTISQTINNITSFVSMLFAFCIYFFSNSVGYKMFMLQSKNIDSFEDVINDKVDSLQSSLDDIE